MGCRSDNSFICQAGNLNRTQASVRGGSLSEKLNIDEILCQILKNIIHPRHVHLYILKLKWVKNEGVTEKTSISCQHFPSVLRGQARSYCGMIDAR